MNKKEFRQRISNAWSKDTNRYPNANFDDWIIDIMYNHLIVRKNKVPSKLQSFMRGLKKEASRDSFVDFCDNWGVDYKTDYQEIKKWFKEHGIDL